MVVVATIIGTGWHKTDRGAGRGVASFIGALWGVGEKEFPVKTYSPR